MTRATTQGATGSPTAVLVDGYNLLHAIPRFAPRGADPVPGRSALEAWLAAAARRHGVNEAVLVWDGPAGARRSRAPRPLEILHTDPGTTADERLLELCRDAYAGRAGTTWVVSSDHGVQRPARQLGFTVLGAMTFWRRWEGRAEMRPAERRGRSRRSRTGGEDDPGGAARPIVGRRDVDELLEVFLERDRRGDPAAS